MDTVNGEKFKLNETNNFTGVSKIGKTYDQEVNLHAVQIVKEDEKRIAEVTLKLDLAE